MQKLSLWGWFIASCAGLYSQTGALTDALDDMTDANREESEAVAAGDGVAVAAASAKKRDAARVARTEHGPRTRTRVEIDEFAVRTSESERECAECVGWGFNKHTDTAQHTPPPSTTVFVSGCDGE